MADIKQTQLFMSIYFKIDPKLIVRRHSFIVRGS